MRSAGDRAVRADLRAPAPLCIRQQGAWSHRSAFHEDTKCDTRLVALVGKRLHRAFVQRQGRAYPFPRNLHVGQLALDPDPPPPEASCHGPGRPRAEEWVENDIAWLGAGEQDAIQQSLGLLRWM